MLDNTTATLPVVTSRVADRLFWPFGLFLVAVAAVLRSWCLATRPGWEWDEGVYAQVSQSGRVQAKTEYLASPEPYLYHPPFHFWLEGLWFKAFGSGITQARSLAVVSSLVMMILLLVLLRRIIGSWALLAVAMISIDSWLVFSERVSWIENTLIPIGVLGLYVYLKSLQRRSLWFFALAGAILGFAVCYKHVGVIFLGAVVIHWFMIRRQKNGHAVLFATAMATVGIYVSSMLYFYGRTYLSQSFVQFQRSTGEESSRGALDSVGDIVGPLFAQYKIFVATMVLAMVAGVLVVVRTIKIVRSRKIDVVREYTLIYAWAASAILFFGVLQLRFPHYFMLALIPLFCYLAVEVRRFVAKQRRHSAKPHQARRFVACAAIVVIALNVLAFYQRFVDPGNDAALRETSIFMTESVPLDAKVIADESVGAVIPQPYCKMWRGADCPGATYIITYTSATQQLPDDPELEGLIASAAKIYEIEGFKEDIIVYRLSEPIND